ncbi:hypothetical protein Bca4012_077540 [Brassica carinata]
MSASAGITTQPSHHATTISALVFPPSPSRDALSLSSHTLSPLSSAYKIAHVRSGVRRRVRARSGAGSSPLTFCLLFLRCCLFLSVSASIYSRICVSDLAPGSSPPERSDGSGGDSVSSRFVVRRWIGGSSCERCRLWLLDSCSRGFSF